MSTSTSDAITPNLAKILVQMADGWLPHELRFPSSTDAHWGSLRSNSVGNIQIENGCLIGTFTLANYTDEPALDFRGPLRIVFSNGAVLNTNDAISTGSTRHFRRLDSEGRMSSSLELSFSAIEWIYDTLSLKPVCWIAKLHGNLDINPMNLQVSGSTKEDAKKIIREFHRSYFWFKGAYDYYLIKSGSSWFLVIGHDSEVDNEMLFQDFIVVQFITGSHISMEPLQGIDEQG